MFNKQTSFNKGSSRWLSSCFAIGVLCAIGVHAAQACAADDHMMMTANELKWAPSAALPAGAQIAVIEGPLSEPAPFIARVKFPANTKVPGHWHSAIEHVTVLSGVMHMGTGDKLDTSKTRAFGPGSVTIMQPGTRHFAWFGEETIIQLHGVGPWTVTYVDPADDPRKK